MDKFIHSDVAGGVILAGSLAGQTAALEDIGFSKERPKRHVNRDPVKAHGGLCHGGDQVTPHDFTFWDFSQQRLKGHTNFVAQYNF